MSIVTTTTYYYEKETKAILQTPSDPLSSSTLMVMVFKNRISRLITKAPGFRSRTSAVVHPLPDL